MQIFSVATFLIAIDIHGKSGNGIFDAIFWQHGCFSKGAVGQRPEMTVKYQRLIKLA
jgi:hypothetical protein